MGRPKKYKVELSDEEVRELKKKIRNKKSSKMIISRCQILLDMDAKHGKVLTHEQSAKSNGVSLSKVASVVKKYAEGGLDEALSYKRSVNSDNARRKVDGRAEARILELATSAAPEGHSRWTLRLLEKESKIILEDPVSREAIRRTLKKLSKAT